MAVKISIIKDKIPEDENLVSESNSAIDDIHQDDELATVFCHPSLIVSHQILGLQPHSLIVPHQILDLQPHSLIVPHQILGLQPHSLIVPHQILGLQHPAS